MYPHLRGQTIRESFPLFGASTHVEIVAACFLDFFLTQALCQSLVYILFAI